MLEPIVRVIEVPCGQEAAFNIFISEMNTWWPLGKYTTSAMDGRPAKSIRVDARPGGAIVEIGHDDTETQWGTLRVYEPYGLLSMDFHIPQPREQVNDRSLVEVRFTSIGPDRTRVQLTQSNWEAFGERAKDMQGGYGGGWTAIFEGAYKAACGAQRHSLEVTEPLPKGDANRVSNTP